MLMLMLLSLLLDCCAEATPGREATSDSGFGRETNESLFGGDSAAAAGGGGGEVVGSFPAPVMQATAGKVVPAPSGS